MNRDRERLFSQLLLEPSGCVVWAGLKLPNGYGKVWFGGRYQLVHRVMYEMFGGPIPVGLEIDHLCRNRPCANVAHLEPVTKLENQRRGWWATRTHCGHGHEFTEENTCWMSRGGRACRACQRDRQRRCKENGSIGD